MPRTPSEIHGGRRQFAGVLAVAALVLSAAACTGTSGNAGGGSGSAVLVMANRAPYTSWNYNPWATTFPAAATGFVYLPLAIQDSPSLTKFTPQLATSWSVQGDQLSVKLQPHAKWQDGTPVTSTDVIDSIYLYGLTGAPIWHDISALSDSGPQEVVLTARTGTPMTVLENDLFNGVTPYPASVWGKYVTPSVKDDVVAYANLAVTDPSAAASSPFGKRLSAALQDLLKFQPSTLVGDGPYKLTGITTQEAKLVKWDGFYAASHITVRQISYLAASQPQVNADLLSGRADFSSDWTYMPPAIVQQWTTTRNAHLLSVPGAFQGQVVFNDQEYPFTLTAVRQALAYALPLKKMDELAWGTVSPHAMPPDIPDGLTPQVEKQFLTASQIDSLNRYEYDTGKAADLLSSAGFHQSGQWWMMPNGQQFKLSLSVDTNWTDQIAALKVAASSLTSMGIQTTLDTVEDGTYQNNLHQGAFQVAVYCCGGGDPNPIVDFAQSPMGSAKNFTTYGAAKGQRGIGFGPVANVSGLGNVNIPATLDDEARSIGMGPQMNNLAWVWAHFVNDQVPYIEYADFTNQIAYSSNRFAWPSTDDPLWTTVGSAGRGNYAIIVGQENGSIHPK